MAYHIDKSNKDLVIDGWEAGIADAPEQGIAMMRNVNLISVPGEGCVNFATSAVTIPPTGVTAMACTFTAATDTVSWTTSGINLYTGLAVKFGSSSGGVTAGTVYWISNVVNASTGTFKVYTDIGHSQLVDLTADGSNTFTVFVFGQGTHKALDVINNNVFFLDLTGQAWWVNTSGNLIFLGNTTLDSPVHGQGLVTIASASNTGFLLVFRDTNIDYLPTTYLTSTSTPAWTYGWQTITTTASAGTSHYAIFAQDNAVYFCNNQTVGSILSKGGNNIDPSSSSTYTFGANALLLPVVDRATCLAELGSSLLVGGIQNKVYPWDRVSTSYAYPLILAENLTTRMVTTNSTTYIFAGNRGRIYRTNGSNVDLFKKVPDSITTVTDPYFTWLDAIYWKNQIYFSFLTSKNDGTAITNLGGVWAIDVSMNVMGTPTSVAFRMTNTLTQGVTPYAYVIAPNVQSTTPAGAGLYIAWVIASGPQYGLDVTTSTPYNDYTNGTGAQIFCDLIPTGTLYAPKTWTQIEWKMAEPMVAGEKIRISVRQSGYAAGFIQVGETTAAVLSDVYAVNFQNGQWLQVLVEMQSTNTTPTYNRLKEIRLR